LKILFSPSESKVSGGNDKIFSHDSFLFPELYEKRCEVINAYNKFIETATNEQLAQLFGINDNKLFENYKQNLYLSSTMKSIERYNGVAYDYLKYTSLDQGAKNYIDRNTIIFSNLFGPILAGNPHLPEYKLKQGEKIGDFAAEIFYKKYFSSALDSFLKDDDILDLRSSFYDKFYKPTSKYTTLKFIKDGKIISHWAKAYRGIVLRWLAINNIQNINDFLKIQIDGLSLQNIHNKKNHTEVVYSID